MAEKINKDAAYRAAKPKDKDYTISDGGGLSLLVKSNGVKRWIFIYRFEGVQNRLGFGSLTTTSPAMNGEFGNLRIDIVTDPLLWLM